MHAQSDITAGRYAISNRLALALRDMAAGLAAYEIWGLLGFQDIRQRYRRSVLGPFWFTVSTAILVIMLGLLYSGLFNQPARIYVPFVAVGMVAWSFMSALLTEACSVFIVSEVLIKQVRAPLTVHVCRMVWRNLLIFIHNSVILIAVCALFWNGWHWHLLLAPVAVAVYALNGLWTGLLLGTLCARFRDIPPIVTNLIQIAFFATPIMWAPEFLEARGMTWIAHINPVHHFIELLRAPLLGQAVPWQSWGVAVAVTFTGTAAAIAVLRRYRHRVPYWL